MASQPPSLVPAVEPSPDEALVERVVGGETALFELLMRGNNTRLYRAIRSVLRDEDAVEDLMQQTYVLAFSRLAQFGGGARFSTWLLRIGINEALQKLRRARRGPQGGGGGLGGGAAVEAEGPGPGELRARAGLAGVGGGAVGE